MTNITEQDVLGFIANAVDSASLLPIKNGLQQKFDQLRQNEIKEYIKKGQDLAARYGLEPTELETLLSTPLSKHGKNEKLDVKYRHPNQPESTWAGRGKRPNWVSQWLSDNPTKKLEDLLINKPAVAEKEAEPKPADTSNKDKSEKVEGETQAAAPVKTQTKIDNAMAKFEQSKK